MNYLSDTNLKNVTGGSISVGLVVVLIGIGAFVIGFLDGLKRPYSCRVE